MTPRALPPTIEPIPAQPPRPFASAPATGITGRREGVPLYIPHLVAQLIAHAIAKLIAKST